MNRSHTCSCALCNVHVISGNFDWFIGCSVSFVIGQSDYFGFGFGFLQPSVKNPSIHMPRDYYLLIFNFLPCVYIHASLVTRASCSKSAEVNQEID